MDSKPSDMQQTLRLLDRHTNALLNTDLRQFQQHIQDFHRFLQDNEQIRSVLDSALDKSDLSTDKWWAEQSEKVDWESRQGTWHFPTNPEDMFRLQYELIYDQANDSDPNFIEQQNKLTLSWSRENQEATKQLFLSKIVGPFCEDLRSMLDQNNATVQQLEQTSISNRTTELAADDESRIFLSHKSANKPQVERYHRVLSEFGYKPWLDEDAMPAGTLLDRGILAGIKESCAVVFFITEEFADERILADEINYAKNRKRENGDRFAIITLRFSTSAEIPELLKTYVWKDVDNDLDGLYEIVRALPIKLGPAYWRQGLDDET